jgi:hypothetical protein
MVRPETWPKGVRWDRGPWNGKRAQAAAFMASLCVAAGGGWLGHNQTTRDLTPAKPPVEHAEASSSSLATDVDTVVGATIGFIGTELILNLGMVVAERRYILNRPELYNNTLDATV